MNGQQRARIARRLRKKEDPSRPSEAQTAVYILHRKGGEFEGNPSGVPLIFDKQHFGGAKMLSPGVAGRDPSGVPPIFNQHVLRLF